MVELWNGDKYIGELVKNVKSGQGKYVWENGSYYDGQWKNDTMNGKGTFVNSSDGTKLVGEFLDGVPDGKCTYYYQSDGKTKSCDTNWEKGKCVKVSE